jgi:hypothetical protein
MQHALTCPPNDCPDIEPNSSFNVLIAYEDFDTGKHAKRTYDFLADTLGDECQVTNQMWKFDVLGIPKLREIAAGDAATSDIVVISCHGTELPETVKKWIECWLQSPGRPMALVALFDRAPDQRLRSYLAEVARRGNMEFFAQPDQWPGRNPRLEHLPLHHEPRLNDRALSTLAGVVRQEVSSSRWDYFD